MNIDKEDNILYELLIHVEWLLEPDIIDTDFVSQGGSIFYRTLTKTPKNIWTLALNTVQLLRPKNLVSSNLSRILGSGSEWQLGIGAQGAVIAILQNSCLEIRAKKDEYATVVGKFSNLYFDPFPSWRKITWSSECSMVAVAYSNGAVEIFNTVGASLFTIYPPKFQESKNQIDTRNALALLVFSDIRTQKIKWAAELIMVDFYGTVRGYFVSPTEGYQESHSFSLHKLYPAGISAAEVTGSLLIVAGSCQYLDDQKLRNNGLGHGLSIWRMINDYPYYKQVPTIDEEDYESPSANFLHHIPGFQTVPTYDCIFGLCVSPLGRQIAALHTSGSISIWDVPSLRKKKFWSLENQSGFQLLNDSISNEQIQLSMQKENSNSMEDIKNHISDVKWWSESAIIICRFSGAITISSSSSLINLLGESPEFFVGMPRISEAFERGFLGLEIERKLVKSDRSYANTSEPTYRDGSGDESEMFDEELSFLKKSGLIIKKVLYWITDSDRFRIVDKRPKMVSRIGRLLCLKSTTPAELFGRKIENEEYGEALALAQRYNLDCDLVYQQQWNKVPVTVVTIQDYLTKIKKRSWVLEECLKRVPNDIDAARELILYGLRGTELDTIVEIGNGTNSDEFVVTDLSLEYEEDYDLNPAEAEIQVKEWAAKDMKRRQELLSQINFHNLTVEQISVIKSRQKLLKYFDRLGAYEILLGMDVASELYDPKFYEKFRVQSETEAAIEFARSYNWKGVEVMFTYHSDITLPHRLPILSNFPPTMCPYDYRSLLPECDLSGEVFEWEIDSLRDADWSEDSICKKAVGSDNDVAIESLYESDPNLEKFRNTSLNTDLISEWYLNRAREMEKTSHFVDASLDLLKLGRERNIPNLEDLQNIFDTLEVIVYEVGLSSISLQEFESFDDLEKLKMLMSTSTLETFIPNFHRWGQPFLKSCEKKELGLGIRILRDYVTWTANEDLSFALKAIQNSQNDQHDAIIGSSIEVLRVALDCIYLCDKETQLPRAFAILESLPVRQSGDSKELSELHDLVDRLEDHLGAAELLSSHGILVSPSVMKKVQGDVPQIKLLLTRLSRTAARSENKMSYEDWNKLLSEMLELQQKIFNAVEPQTCFEILTESLLTSGTKQYIDFAKELLDTRVDGSPIHNPYLQKLPYKTSIKLVIKAATEYFNSSESYFDSDMDLARHCLNLIESENFEIKREMDLISSLEILPGIGINKLPLQVRLCDDRLNLIEEALKRCPSNHQHGSRILHLADLLRVCGDDQRLRRAKVLSLIAEAAFETGDSVSCWNWCSLLLEGGYSEGWQICARLGRCPENNDLLQRAKLLNFSLTHSSHESLEELLAARNEVELGLLYEKVSLQIVPLASPDSDDGFEDARANSDAELTDEDWSDTRTESLDAASPTVASSAGILGLPFSFTKGVLSTTAATTSSIVSNVAGKKLWKNAVSWLRPLKGQSVGSSKDDPSELGCNSGFEKQGCHAFYADLNPEAHVSSLGVTYKSYALPIIYNPALNVSFNLLRIALIEETLLQGNSCYTNATVLQEVARGILEEDLVLGLSLLLLLSSKDAHEVLSTIPRTEISLQISLYYYALQIYTLLHPHDEQGIAPVFLHPPSDVIECVAASTFDGEANPNGENLDEFQFYAEQFRNVQQMVSDFIQGQSLQKLGSGVNIERFLSDPEYKKDSVLGLAMSSDLEVLNLSVSLARKYNVSLWEVYMTHLQYLFDSNIETEKVKALIKERQLMENLQTNTEEFVSRMERDVKFTISGVDHNRLVLFYSLIQSASKKKELKRIYKTHIQLLGELQEVAATLDYKALTSPTADLLEVLKDVLTSKNVSALAEVIKRLPRENAQPHDPSVVFCAWAQKHFLDTSSQRRPKTTSEWIRRYDETQETLNQMRASDVNRLIESFVFSTETSSAIPIEARKEILKKAAKFCSSMGSSAKNDVERSSWLDVFMKFQKLEKHLDLLKSETFKNLSLNSGPELSRYALQFSMCGGEEAALQKLSRSVMENLSSMEVLRSLLSVYPDEFAQAPEDIFMDVFRASLEALSIEIPVKVESETKFTPSASEILTHLLKELKSYSEDGGELLQEDEIMDELREFSHNDGNPLSSRIFVLTEAQKYISISEDDERHLRKMRTGGIVEAAFNSPPSMDRVQKREEQPSVSSTFSPKKAMVDTKRVDSEEGRMELLETLFSKMNSMKKANSIIELLNLWPPLSSEVYSSVTSNPWSILITKLLKHYNQKDRTKDFWSLISTTALVAITNKQLPTECIDDIVERIIRVQSPIGLLVAAKISFHSLNSCSSENVLTKYRDMDQIDLDSYDEELLRLIIIKEAVPRVLPTCLYGPLVTFLGEECNKQLKAQAVQQLESANHWIEAASLSAFSSSIPKSLKTASNVFNSFKNWL